MVVLPDLPEWQIIPPVKNYKITQGFHIIHKALDLIGDREILSVGYGKVIKANWEGGYGNRIEIQHNNGFISSYSHLSEFKVEIGDEVMAGQVIGIIGSTGWGTGVHLHWELLYNGTKINPLKYIGG